MLSSSYSLFGRGSKLLALSFLFLILNSSPISAIEYGGIGLKPLNPDPDNSRTKSIYIFNLDAGEEESDEVLVINNTAEDKTVLLYATDSQKSTDGSFACEQYLDEKDGVGSWIILEIEELEIPAHTSIEVPFDIQIPETASVGEQNGCIMLQEKKIADQDASGVSLSFRTGLRVVVTVPGEQVRKLTLTDFEADQIDRRTISTRTEVRNDGTVSIDSSIHLKTEYFWGIGGNEVINQYPILRNDTAVFNIDLNSPEWGGLIKTSATIEYDNSSEASVGVDSAQPNTYIYSEPEYFLFLPTPQKALIELGILALIFTLILIIWSYFKKKDEVRKVWDTYTVKSGENLEVIAKQRGIGWKKIAKANRIKPPYNIEPGRKIKLPPRG